MLPAVPTLEVETVLRDICLGETLCHPVLKTVSVPERGGDSS